MAPTKRKKAKFHLLSGDDPSLWKYENNSSALRSNLDIVARLINAKCQAIDTSEEQEFLSLHSNLEVIAKDMVSTQTTSPTLVGGFR